MNILLNGGNVEIPTETTLFELLELKAFTSKKGIAVAVNNSVVSKPNWSSQTLQPNDKIMIISATKGG